jgi:hypothetical protein
MGSSESPKGWTWRAFVKAGLSKSEAGELAAYYIEVKSKPCGGRFYA